MRGGYLVIPPSQVEAACAEGFDGMSKLVTRVPLTLTLTNLNPTPTPSPSPSPSPSPNPNQVTRVLGEEAWLRMVSNPLGGLGIGLWVGLGIGLWVGLELRLARTSTPTLTSSTPG